MGRPFPPQNCPFPCGDLDPHLIHGSLGPPESPQPKGHLDRCSRFCRLTNVTDRPTDTPTDHATRSVTLGRIYVRSTAMPPNNHNYCALIESSLVEPSKRERGSWMRRRRTVAISFVHYPSLTATCISTTRQCEYSLYILQNCHRGTLVDVQCFHAMVRRKAPDKVARYQVRNDIIWRAFGDAGIRVI